MTYVPWPQRTDLPDEHKIARLIIDNFIAEGYLITVANEEDYSISKSENAEAVFQSLGQTDVDVIYAISRDGTEPPRGVVLNYWNTGSELIEDYHVSIEHLLKPALDFTESLW